MRAWTRSVPVLTSGYRDATTDADGRGRQTYLSLVCGPDDVIHVVSRQIRLNTGLYYRGSTYFVLVHQKLSRGRHWSAPTFMVVPPEERRFHHRMVLISEDGGARWRFATAADFAAGMEAYAVEAQPHTAAGEQAGTGDTPAAHRLRSRDSCAADVATQLLKAGVHPKVGPERLGHASIGITLDMYSQVMPGMQEVAPAGL